MPAGPLSKAIQDLRQSMLPEGEGLNDGQLLDHFIERRDETAFAALVRRHGALVWGVCRRVVGHHHDAEDAFQATFLVLARKAASVRPRHLVPNWLYGVAQRTALKARSAAGRRGMREKQVLTMPEPEPGPADPWQDLEPLLDQELARLPDKYRVAIVLCDLQGKTGKEAAHQLKIPEGTLSSRLRTARGMLARRLSRYRPLLSGAALAALLSRDVAAAAPPAALLSATSKAGPLAAAGQASLGGVVSVNVAALMEGVLKTMLLNKIKLASVVFLLLSLIALGATQLTQQTATGQQTQAEPKDPKSSSQKAKPAQGEPKEDPKLRHQAFTCTGRAVDQDGKPVAEATIYLVSTNNSPSRLLGKTTTDREGRYAFRDVQLPYEVQKEPDKWEGGTFQVFGKAPGCAFAWEGMKFLYTKLPPGVQKESLRKNSYLAGDPIAIDLTFGPPRKVEGRIVNEKGEPIAGVKLRLGNCDHLNTAGKEEFRNFREFWAMYQAVTIMPEQVTAVTDDKGRFEFPHVPQDVVCWMLLEHSGYADMALYTATADNPPETHDENHPVLKLPLQLTLHSVRTIRVQVRSRQTDQPLAGIRIHGYQKRATGPSSGGTTDKEGQVTLKLPPGKYRLVGDPPRKSDHVRTYQDLTVEPAPAEQTVTLRQELGCVLILKAVDAASGKGVARVTFWYEFERDGQQGRTSVQSGTAYVDNPVTNDNGELRAVVQPGTRRYGIGFGPLPEGYEGDNSDLVQGRVLELSAGKTVTETFRLRKK